MNTDWINSIKDMRVSTPLDDFLAKLDKVTMSCHPKAKATKRTRTRSVVEHVPSLCDDASRKRRRCDMQGHPEDSTQHQRIKRNPRNLSPSTQHVQHGRLCPADGVDPVITPTMTEPTIGGSGGFGTITYNERCGVSNQQEIDLLISPKGSFHFGVTGPAPIRNRFVPPSA